MPGARIRWLLSAGMGSFALAAMAQVQAQMAPQPQPPAMQVGPVLAPAAPAAVYQASPPVVAAPVPPPPACSCGELHGLSRWWWHKTQCKRHLQEWALGYPEEFNEWPLGSSLYAHGRTQVANGNAARMVFYHYDFVDGTDQLNVRGRDKLVKVSRLLPSTFFPVVIERTPSKPGLDEQRRAGLLAELCESRFPIPPERVVIGPPIAAGLTGYEAVYVYGNQLGALQSGGAGGVGAYSGTPGLSAGGLSGSAGFFGGGGGLGSGR